MKMKVSSHDTSDLGDKMWEGSDDFELHGAWSVPLETSSRNAQEALAVKVTERDSVSISCNFSFINEKVYSKHYNCHLVKNVCFFERAVKGQR